MKKTVIGFIAIFSCYYAAYAQEWTSAGSNIYNANTGTVVIQASTPTGGQKLVVDPKGPGSITLGDANTGVGGYTSLNFYISAYQDGYSSIQSIKSSGSSYGVLSLNPGGGGVGIGTSDPGSFKLAVEGKIGAREIKVTLANPWPDYVFQRDYPRLSLTNLEKYIRQNQHLPGIPTAKEVEENEGIDLGAMNVKLLEKIEELTLYVIELKNEIEKLKERE